MGAAVGLGNLWKFPYTLGTNGGSAFVLVYLVAIFVVATPIMMGEMVIGRRGGLSPPNTFRRLAEQSGSSRHWGLLGWMGILALFLVLSFFSVVAGWSLAYMVKTAAGTFSGLDAAAVEALFEEFKRKP